MKGRRNNATHLPEPCAGVASTLVLMEGGRRRALPPEAAGDESALVSGEPPCCAITLFLIPRTSAGERSSNAERSLDGSTVEGPPFLYTPV